MAVLVVGGLLRVWWVLYAARPPAVMNDPFAYTYYGQEIARGHGYISFVTGAPTAFFPVGYPAALAGVAWLVTHTPIPDNLPRAIGMFQVGCGLVTVGLVYDVARRLFAARTGLIAAAIVAFWPGLIYYTGVAQLENLFMPLSMAALAIAVRAPWPLSRRRLLALGLVLGAATLVRPFALFFLPPLAVSLVLARLGWRRALIQTGAVALVVVAVLTPWTIRNARAMQSFVPISTNLGDTVCLDRREGATGEFNVATEACIDPYADVPLERSEVVRNRENLRKALRWIVEHPADEVRLWFWRAFHTLEHDHGGIVFVESDGHDAFIGARARRVLTTVADAYFFVMLALAALGLPAFLRRSRPQRVFFALCLFGLMLVPLLLYGYERFHVPWLPLLAILAADPLSRLTQAREATADL